MAWYSLVTLLLVGVQYLSCNPTPLDELTINLNLLDSTKDEEPAAYETSDEEHEMKDGQMSPFVPVVIGGFDGNGSFIQQDEFFGRAGKWLGLIYPRKSKRSGMGVAGRNNFIFMAGGQDKDEEPTNEVYQRTFYKPWQKSKNLQSKRTLPTLSVVNIIVKGKRERTLLVTGGKNAKDQFLKSTELLSPETKTWVYSDPMTEARFGHAAVVLNNIVIVLGGDTKSSESIESTESTECYHIDQKWHECKPMNVKRTFHAATVLDDAIYVCGGQKHMGGATINLRSCEVSRNFQEFVPVKAMQKKRTKFGMLTIDGEVWAIGGQDEDGIVLNTVEKFNPQTQMWTMHNETLRTPRQLFGAITVVDNNN